MTAENFHSITFTENNKKFCLSLHYNGENSYLLMVQISKDFPVDNMIKTGLNEYVYDLSVDYKATAVNDVLDIHQYLMKKNGIL